MRLLSLLLISWALAGSNADLVARWDPTLNYDWNQIDPATSYILVAKDAATFRLVQSTCDTIPVVQYGESCCRLTLYPGQNFLTVGVFSISDLEFETQCLSQLRTTVTAFTIEPREDFTVVPTSPVMPNGGATGVDAQPQNIADANEMTPHLLACRPVPTYLAYKPDGVHKAIIHVEDDFKRWFHRDDQITQEQVVLSTAVTTNLNDAQKMLVFPLNGVITKIAFPYQLWSSYSALRNPDNAIIKLFNRCLEAGLPIMSVDIANLYKWQWTRVYINQAIDYKMLVIFPANQDVLKTLLSPQTTTYSVPTVAETQIVDIQVSAVMNATRHGVGTPILIAPTIWEAYDPQAPSGLPLPLPVLSDDGLAVDRVTADIYKLSAMVEIYLNIKLNQSQIGHLVRLLTKPPTQVFAMETSADVGFLDLTYLYQPTINTNNFVSTIRQYSPNAAAYLQQLQKPLNSVMQS